MHEESQKKKQEDFHKDYEKDSKKRNAENAFKDWL